MLKIHLEELETFNESTNEFIRLPGADLSLEHSLVSISKWESKWKKPFIGKDKHTDEEILDYVKYMTITQNVPEDVYENLKNNRRALEKINNYINNSMSATTFSQNLAEQTGKSGLPTHKSNNGKMVTSELIYFWMVSYQIPFECERWHLNRLLTLIRICNIENGNQQKMSKRDTVRSNAALNRARRQQHNTRG